MDLLSDEFPWNLDHTFQQLDEISSAQAPLLAGITLEAPRIPPPVPFALVAPESRSHEAQQLRWYGLNE